MAMPNWNDLKVGDKLPPLTKPPISRTTLALFAGAANDHNPMHIDIDVARSAGMDDVFAQGMLPMAYLGQLLTGWVPQTALRSFAVRFASITHLQDELTCTGEVVEKVVEGGEHRVHLALVVHDQANDIKLTGSAIIALPTN